MAKTKPIETNVIQLIPAELSPVLKDTKIELSKAEGHAIAFAPSMGQYIEIADILKSLDKTNPTEIHAKQAHEARLKMVNIRTSAEKIKDLRKEGIKAEGDLIQALYNVVKNSCIVTETEFAEIEKHQERKEKERQDNLEAARKELLAEFGTDTTYLPLGIMTGDQFTRVLENETLAFNARKEQAEKAEAMRIETERLAEEARLEQLRLQAERIEAERLEAIRVKEENDKLQAQLDSERKEAQFAADKLAKENADKLAEQQRLAKIETDKQAKLLAEQKQSADKLAAELQAKKDAEAKELEAQRLAKIAPDKDKINQLYLALKNLEIPKFESIEAATIGDYVKQNIAQLLEDIKFKAQKLK